MNKFEEIKEKLMQEPLEDLLEQVFSGSYTPGPTEAAIRIKVKKLKDVELKLLKEILEDLKHIRRNKIGKTVGVKAI